MTSPRRSWARFRCSWAWPISESGSISAAMDEWALRASKGDAAAFGFLVRRHQGQVRGFLLRVTGGRHALADDLAQETFLEAWAKIAQFRGQGSFAGWLLGIAWSRVL